MSSASQPPRAETVATAEPAVEHMRTVLRTNVVFTSICAVVLVAGAEQVSEVLRTGHEGWIRLLGVGLALFAADVWLLARTHDVKRLRAGTLTVSIADAGWVLASAATIAAGWYGGPGNLLVVAVALVVGALGVAEYAAWNATATAVDARPVRHLPAPTISSV